MATKDAIQHDFEVGDIVLIPVKVTAIGGTAAQPTVTGNSKYLNWAGAASVHTADARQVIKDE